MKKNIFTFMLQIGEVAVYYIQEEITEMFSVSQPSVLEGNKVTKESLVSKIVLA